MITYTVDEHDIATARFGISPLSETCLSLRALVRPQRYPHLVRWGRAMQPRLVGLDHELLRSLVAEDESTPDFLNPRPSASLTELDDELRALGQVSARTVDADVEAIYPDGRPAPLQIPAARLREKIAVAMEAYWQACILPWWPRMLATLRADIAHRAMVAAECGQQEMLRNLNEGMAWRENELHGWNPNGPDYRASVDGRGLVFVPTHFSSWVSYPFSPKTPPYVLYPARAGVVSFEEPLDAARSPADGDDPLTRLIGRARARVLSDLDHPTSSTDLAGLLGISVTGANQHLRSLRDAGLLDATRHGRSVLYYRTGLGESLAVTGTSGSSSAASPNVSGGSGGPQ